MQCLLLCSRCCVILVLLALHQLTLNFPLLLLSRSPPVLPGAQLSVRLNLISASQPVCNQIRVKDIQKVGETYFGTKLQIDSNSS